MVTFLIVTQKIGGSNPPLREILWAVGRKVMHILCKNEDEIARFSRSTMIVAPLAYG